MNRRAIGWLATVALAGMVTGARAQAATVNGEVVKIDKAGGRITLKHGEIKGLDMPPMTLSWRVAPPRLLENLVVGDRVRFVPARIDGQYTITALNKSAP